MGLLFLLKTDSSRRPAGSKTACPRRLYIGVDEVLVPLRDVWKQQGSLGELTCRYAEWKVGVVYETERDQEGEDARVRWQDYVATFADAETFSPLVGTLAHKNGHHAAQGRLPQ